MTTSSEKTNWLHCNKCSHKTKHELLIKRSQPGSEPYDEEFDISWCTTWWVFECCGCGNVTLKRTFWFSEWNPGELEVEYYPPQVSRRTPEWADKLSFEVSSLLEEIYTALHADSRRLALMGARTIVDMFMLEKIGDIGGFAQKLNELEKQGYISTRNKKILEAALNAGSAAAHRGYDPGIKEVNHVIDIVENLLQTDVLETAANHLSTKTPKRKKTE